jgi:DDE superfamily endonuclease
MDEVHFQQHGSRCRMWVPPEVKDPVLLHHPTRKSVGYFGAVRLRDGKFVFCRETNRFDARTTWSFLDLLRQRSRRAARRVVLIVDNAKYIITPTCTEPGEKSRLQISCWTTCRPIARSSIRSNVSGSWCANSVCTMNTSPPFKRSSTPQKASLQNGEIRMKLCGDCAQYDFILFAIT